MNRTIFRTPVKAAVAGVAGVALLAGVGGSFAYWSETESIASAAEITQGRLSLASAGGAQWVSNLTGEAITDVNAYRVVPGETLTFRDTVTLTAEGDQLAATLTTNAADVTGAASEDGSLVVEQRISDGAESAVSFGEALTVGAADNGREFTVEVDVAFPAEGTAQGQSVDLSDIEATVAQDVADPA